MRQPLKIDKLPIVMQDKIRASRLIGRTWDEIERQSPSWSEWEKVDAEALALFPEKRLPHTNLQRWYDLRIEQVLREQAQQSIAAHAAADKVAGRDFKNLTASVKHALGETVFSLMNAGGDPDAIAASLTEMGHLLAKFDKNEIAKEKVETEATRVRLLVEEADRKKQQFEQATNEAARKIGKGQTLTLADINRIRERTFGLPPVQQSA